MITVGEGRRARVRVRVREKERNELLHTERPERGKRRFVQHKTGKE